MRWIVDWREGYTLLRYEGDLVVGATQFFENGVTSWLSLPFAPIVLDLSDLKIIASAGLSSLIRLRNAATESGVCLIVVKPSVEAWQVIEMTRVDRLFNFVDTVEHAIAAIAGRSC